MTNEKRKTIEKAVVELGGVYPPHPTDSKLWADNKGNYESFCKYYMPETMTKLICTHAEFEQVKSDMQNKNSKLDDLIENPPEPTEELRERMRDDWHERGEMPPVGERIEYGRKGVSVWRQCTIKAIEKMNDNPSYCAWVMKHDLDGTFAWETIWMHEYDFRPLSDAKKDFIKSVESVIIGCMSSDDYRQRGVSQLAEEVIDFISGYLEGLGWRPPKS